jgi:hypothetical protein
MAQNITTSINSNLKSLWDSFKSENRKYQLSGILEDAIIKIMSANPKYKQLLQEYGLLHEENMENILPDFPKEIET